MVKNSLFPIPAEPLKYDTYADFPSILPDGTLVLDLSTDKLYTYDLSTNTYLPVSSGGQVNTIVAGAGISVDSTDPINPIITATAPSVITDHSLLSNLDYISSGHIGFQEDLDKQHDWVAPYSYCGTAPVGSLTSDAVWTITRITVANDGSVTTSVLSSVKWDDRYILPY